MVAFSASSVALAGSTGFHPPCGAGQGDVKLGGVRLSWTKLPSFALAGSVSVKVLPSYLPVTT